MKRKNIIKNLIAILFLMSSIVFAKSFSAEDIFITTTNPDYTVSNVKILRIASDDSSKIPCQKLHWFLEPYWAPREWDVNLKVEKTGDGEYETVVNPNPYHNNLCGAALITELRVTMYDSIEDKQFSFGSYLYTNGDETIHLKAKVNYNQGDWESQPSHKVIVEIVDRYIDENDSFIDIEVVNGTDKE